MQDKKIVKACNFYVSEWHLYAALLPYLKNELNSNNKIIFISQDNIKKGLKELINRINVKFENKNGIDEIIWLNELPTDIISTICTKTSIIVQGTYEFIENINKCLEKNISNIYKDCTIISCYEVFDTNNMLYNILENHDFVFNTGGLHKKEDIFPDYNKDKIFTKIS